MGTRSFSELPFAALLVYSPHGESGVSIRSRGVRDKIKTADSRTLQLAVQRIREYYRAAGFAAFLGSEMPLVPVPGSSLRVTGGLWVPERIAQALVAAGLGSEVLPCLLRTEAVPKSAFSNPGERPDVARHISTMAVEPQFLPPDRLTLIDDFVTKGRTLFAGASVLARAFPQAEIRAFALVRTMGLVPDVSKILDPCTGIIRLLPGTDDVERTP